MSSLCVCAELLARTTQGAESARPVRLTQPPCVGRIHKQWPDSVSLCLARPTSVFNSTSINGLTLFPCVAVPRSYWARPTKLLGAPDLFVKRGSRLRLTCLLRDSTEPPQFVFWYHERVMINYAQERGVSVRHGRSSSELLIAAANNGDSGNYTCAPSNAQPASISVHVLNADFRRCARAQREEAITSGNYTYAPSNRARAQRPPHIFVHRLPQKPPHAVDSELRLQSGLSPPSPALPLQTTAHPRAVTSGLRRLRGSPRPSSCTSPAVHTQGPLRDMCTRARVCVFSLEEEAEVDAGERAGRPLIALRTFQRTMGKAAAVHWFQNWKSLRLGNIDRLRSLQCFSPG
ncbi:Uncharacterized protein GBIM_07880 [Gryllus bimaculatus]|nr:Uncharacterized protein GBIM_07880 [Gryllus bimaculatus]